MQRTELGGAPESMQPAVYTDKLAGLGNESKLEGSPYKCYSKRVRSQQPQFLILAKIIIMSVIEIRAIGALCDPESNLMDPAFC